MRLLRNHQALRLFTVDPSQRVAFSLQIASRPEMALELGHRAPILRLQRGASSFRRDVRAVLSALAHRPFTRCLGHLELSKKEYRRLDWLNYQHVFLTFPRLRSPGPRPQQTQYLVRTLPGSEASHCVLMW